VIDPPPSLTLYEHEPKLTATGIWIAAGRTPHTADVLQKDGKYSLVLHCKPPWKRLVWVIRNCAETRLGSATAAC
jgi:hypothetical protein